MAKAKRRLLAILAADVAGYSRLMGADEEGTVETLDAYRRIFGDIIEQHNGRVVDTAGDSILAVFESAVAAIRSAVDIQSALSIRNADLPEDKRMQFRIGVNSGDIIERVDGTVYGEGVNIAARIEGLATPGGVTVSEDVYRYVRKRSDLNFEDFGEHQVKNIAEPVRTYQVTESVASQPRPVRGGDRLSKVPIAAIATVTIIFIGIGAWQTNSFVEWRGERVIDHRPISDPNHTQSIGPSIAVLPFNDLSEGSAQDYFVDGLTEEVISTLARFPDFAVVARNSSYRYVGQAVDVRTVGQELGARYLVEGSVRRGDGNLRVTAQLIETETGSHLWSETYDRPLTSASVLAVQDEIAVAIGTAIGGAWGILNQEGLAAARRKAPADLESYDCVLLTMDHWRAESDATHETARSCLKHTVNNHPDYARAWGYLAILYVQEYTVGHNPKPDSLERALKAAEHAVRLAPNAIRSHWALAFTHFHRGNLDAFMAQVERAIDAASDGVDLPGPIGIFLAYSGNWEQGLAIIERAKARDPHIPRAFHFVNFLDRYRQGDYQAALQIARSVGLPDEVWAEALVAAAYGQLGQVDKAEPYARHILALEPDFEATARADYWKMLRYQEDLLDQFMAGLRQAGLNVAHKGG